jgi:twitching motility two-component system response regulator PilH
MAKILIIDDSWLIRQATLGILKRNGFDVLIAENGQAGIDIAKSENPDVVILDLLMPDLYGLDVLKQLQEAGLQMPVIIMSADIQDTTQQKCREAKAFDFMQKPPKEEIVIFKVNKALKERVKP